MAVRLSGGPRRRKRNGFLMLTIAEHALRRGHATGAEALLRRIAECYPASLEGLAARLYLRDANCTQNPLQ